MLNRFWYIMRSVFVVITSIVFLLSLELSAEYTVWRWICWGVWFASLIIRSYFDRCPHCHKPTHTRIFSQTAGFCSHCGQLIEWQDPPD